MSSFSLGENQNLAIKASAGSGKTFQLAMRFIALLFREAKADPAQIVAITFTRKAAGEILDKIVEQLLLMMADKAVLAKRIEQELLPPELSAADLPELLGRILRSRELQIGTIDSFLVRIIQAFSPEFGISGALEMVDEATDTGTEQVLREVIRREREKLLPLLKDFAEGDNARNLVDTLRQFIADNYEKYLLFPQVESWGNLPVLGTARLTQEEIDRAACTLRIGREHYDYPPQITAQLEKLIELAQAGKTRNFDLGFAPDRLFFYRKAYPASDEMIAAAGKLVRHLATIDLDNKQTKSRAAYYLLKLFDDLYSEKIRSQGRIAFRDLPKLLGALPPECRLDLEYRLDTRNRHYLLDEFQDTSDSQWKFMENLISEAIQGPEQSFFLVGDVKQSLYLWRHGNPRLFDLICRKYNLEVRFSNKSFRSAPAVIETVNRTFLSGERQSKKYQDMLTRLDFQEHSTDNGELSGYAQLMQVLNDEGKSNRSLRLDRVRKILTELQPLARGLSVAVLLRTNPEVEEYKQGLMQLLKSEPISAEGAAKPAESLVCTVLLLLLRLANHPGDAFARALRLIGLPGGPTFTPASLAAKLELAPAADWETLSERLHAELVSSGLSGLIDRFRQAFAAELTAFDFERVAVVSRAARNFAGTVDEFLDCWSKLQGADQSRRGTIQIMTIHKSKGLEFDVVILPELGERKVGSIPALEVEPMPPDAADFVPRWVSYLPGEITCNTLPGLAEIKSALEADKFYEQGCGLYVAMTRAKRALYMLLGDLPKSENKQFRADQMLYHALQGESALPNAAGVFESGDPRWYESATVTAVPPKPGSSRPRHALPATEIRWISPSALHEEEPGGAYSPLSFELSLGAELGTRIHAMFEQVEFVETLDPALEKLAGADDLGRRVRDIWNFALTPGGEIYRALSRPAGNVELHREWRFLLRTPRGENVSGCFDRVEVFRDDSGQIVSATISDYKSDDLSSEAEFLARHSAQLNAYRAALSQMLQIAPEKITCRLLALRLGKVITVEE